MQLTRRTFVRVTAAVAGVAVTGMGFALRPVRAYAAELRKDLTSATRTTTVCPYCAVGCGFVVHSSGGQVINVEGDLEHPINRGSACSKGSALHQLANNPARLRTVRYRAPGASEWEERDWSWAVSRIAERIKATRDATFEITNSSGQVVNRTLGMASWGSAALDNEECWLYQKFLRALGLVYIEHQARN